MLKKKLEDKNIFFADPIKEKSMIVIEEEAQERK